MTVMTIEELAETLPPHAAIAGLDLGTKTIGLAVSDLSRRFATPRPVIRRVKFTHDAETLLAFAEKEEIAGFVIGLPVNMDGSSGPRVQATRAFVRNMEALTPLTFTFWDERLSTVEARARLHSAGELHRQSDHPFAAQVIVETWLGAFAETKRAPHGG